MEQQTDQIQTDGDGYDTLLRANVARVFNERDSQRRLAAMAELWSPDPILYERDALLVGVQNISGHLDELHRRLPAGTVFEPTGQVVGHHGTAILKWKAHANGHRTHTTGTDVVFVQDGRIHRLYVFLDPH
jgi:hypothetical protein